MTFQSQEQFQFIESILFENLGKKPEIIDFQFFYGGNFNLAVRVKVKEGDFFIKWNQGGLNDMFESEANSLQLLRETNTVHIPAVINHGRNGEKEYLMIEFVSAGFQQENYWEDFGQKLALLHRNSNEQFGLHFNNYIGALRQSNEWMENGVAFFIEKRLKIQVELALYDRKITPEIAKKFEKLFEEIPNLIPNEKPALIHGDLWSGNVMTDSKGLVALVDPAAYYGLREAELAFTTMFGGFETTFYEAYHEVYPIAKGYSQRIPIYNLYPLMVHVNLFGGGYLDAVEKILKKFE
ncbi:Fructosamine-3-kinase [Pseudarcicella hirudinis]|uniref:Fructosamine-3-kinase n=1 Tax=Pseudarcicella hirudinis TaxID=1079859 RepID=A0A1I5QF65_9BACT|nr:fructosamine kinase family protein [Pseudarcicella hirudinis]SFP44929.1 Fructosamine-3-kinase [Pseudarcicella hirudinis]